MKRIIAALVLVAGVAQADDYSWATKPYTGPSPMEKWEQQWDQDHPPASSTWMPEPWKPEKSEPRGYEVSPPVGFPEAPGWAWQLRRVY